MRDYPDPDRQIRENFEALRDDLRNQKINIAVNAATGAYYGAQVGGPVGAAIGVGIGTLIGYWQYKAYRKQVYAMYAAAGLVRKPRRRIRSIFYPSDDPAFYRYPYPELVGDVVLDLMKRTKPDMTEAEINKQAYAIVKAFDIFRRENPDIPVEIAADVILMLNGIMRNPQSGMYEKVVIQEEPEPPPDGLPRDGERDEREKISHVAIAWGLAGLAFFIYLLRRK